MLSIRQARYEPEKLERLFAVPERCRRRLGLYGN